MSEQECIEGLDAISGYDPEASHSDAEDLLCAFLREHHPNIADAFDRVRERSCGWYFA